MTGPNPGRELLGGPPSHLIAARHGAKGDVEPIGGIDGDQRERQVHQFLLGELLARLVIHLVRHVVNGNQGHCLRPCQSCPLALGIERGLAPGHQFVDALFRFATRPRRFGMQIDSIGTPVDLGYPNSDEFKEQRLLAG